MALSLDFQAYVLRVLRGPLPTQKYEDCPLGNGPTTTSVFRHWTDHQIGAAAEGRSIGASRPVGHTGVSRMASEARRLAPYGYLFRFPESFRDLFKTISEPFSKP